MTILRLLPLSYFLLNLTLLAFPMSSLAQGTTTTVPPATAPAVEMVDLNTADVATLDRLLEGIGEKRAQAIVDFREQPGPFQTIYDLEQVSGIGPKTIERNKLRLMVSNPETPAAAAATSAPASSTATPPASTETEEEDPPAEPETESESNDAKNSK